MAENDQFSMAFYKGGMMNFMLQLSDSRTQ